MEPATKKTNDLTLKDRLSRLNFQQAFKLLGENSQRLITKGGAIQIDIERQVTLNAEQLDVRFPMAQTKANGSHEALVTIKLSADARESLSWQCSVCDTICEHVGAAFALVLEDKLSLGLAVASLADSLARLMLSTQRAQPQNS